AGGRRVASGSWDGTVRIWDARSREELAAIRLGHRVFALAAVRGASSDLVAIADDRGKIGMFNADTGRHERDLARPKPDVAYALAFDTSGRRLATRTHAAVQLIDIPNDRVLETWPLASSTDFSAVAISGDGSIVAADGPRANVTLWDVASGAARTLPG